MYLATTKFMLGQTEQALTTQNTSMRMRQARGAAKRLSAQSRSTGWNTRTQGNPARGPPAKPEDQTACGCSPRSHCSNATERAQPSSPAGSWPSTPRSAQARDAGHPAGSTDRRHPPRRVAVRAQHGQHGRLLPREFVRALSAFQAGRPGSSAADCTKPKHAHPDRIEALNLISICYLVAGHWGKRQRQN